MTQTSTATRAQLIDTVKYATNTGATQLAESALRRLATLDAQEAPREEHVMTRTELAAVLRNMAIDMTMRYGQSCQSQAFALGKDIFEGKTHDRWDRARARQFKAIQRLTLATLRLTKEV